VIGAIGELLLTSGALVLLFVVYTLFGTGLQTAAAQEDLREQTAAWGQPPADDPNAEPGAAGEPGADGVVPPEEIPLGDAYAIISIPRFGDDWEKVVVQGVEDEDLKNGPGHYLESADPGELGNFAIAAHRSGHGEPFAQFPELRAGDLIEVRNALGTFTYQLTDAPDGDPDGNRIEINDSWVVDPVPGEPSTAEPTQRLITLTTCWPRFGSSHRMYATGVLVDGEEL
jgi:sortase A